MKPELSHPLSVIRCEDRIALIEAVQKGAKKLP